MQLSLRIHAVFLTVCLISYCTGCSWILMQRAPDGYEPNQHLECSGYTIPAIESGLVAGGLVLVVGAAAGGWGGGGGKAMGNFGAVMTGAVGGLIALIHGSSCITGFIWAKTCGNATESHNEWLSGLSPKELEAFKHAVKAERCDRLKALGGEKAMLLETRRRYLRECREFIEKEREASEGKKENPGTGK